MRAAVSTHQSPPHCGHGGGRSRPSWDCHSEHTDPSRSAAGPELHSLRCLAAHTSEQDRTGQERAGQEAESYIHVAAKPTVYMCSIVAEPFLGSIVICVLQYYCNQFTNHIDAILLLHNFQQLPAHTCTGCYTHDIVPVFLRCESE